MSLLDRGNVDILVFPEVQSTDEDGNPLLGPASTGVPARAVIQPRTSDEDDQRGYTTEAVYRMRLSRADESRLGALGAQSQIEWNGERWSLVGNPRQFNGSRDRKITRLNSSHV